MTDTPDDLTPPDPTPEEIRAEIERLEAEQVQRKTDLWNLMNKTPWFKNADPSGLAGERITAVLDKIDELYEALKKKVQS